MAGYTGLFIPGPTNMPEPIRRALNLPMEDIRAPDFPDFTLPLFADLKKVFKLADGRVFIFPSSGTGGWEASIQNTLNPGDKVLMSSFGHFSYLWCVMARRLGLDVDEVEVEWGAGVPLEEYARRLEADTNKEIRAVFACQNETATGVASDIPGVRKILDGLDHPAMLYVDAVSSLASVECDMDKWGIDLCVSGSQKGFMLPTGLGIVGVSARALAAVERVSMPVSYFSFADMIKTNDQGFFPYTPATTLLRGLRASIDMIAEEGLENIFARHRRIAEGVRRGVAGMGLRPCAVEPKWYSDTVTAIVVPDGVDGVEVGRTAYFKYKTSFGSGLSRVAGKVFRIGHLGSTNEAMLLQALAVAEMALLDHGARFEAGAGVGAAIDYYRNNPQAELAHAAE